MVYGWCRRAGLQPADAADVGQEVFAAVARSIHTFRHDRPGDTFRGWLFTITRNKLRDRQTPLGATGIGGSDALRQMAELPTEEQHEPTPAPEANERQAFWRRQIEMVRGEFEPRTWEAFWRAFVDGEAAANIAADLGISTNAVYLAKSRVLHRLREELSALIDWDLQGGP